MSFSLREPIESDDSFHIESFKKNKTHSDEENCIEEKFVMKNDRISKNRNKSSITFKELNLSKKDFSYDNKTNIEKAVKMNSVYINSQTTNYSTNFEINKSFLIKNPVLSNSKYFRSPNSKFSNTERFIKNKKYLQNPKILDINKFIQENINNREITTTDLKVNNIEVQEDEFVLDFIPTKNINDNTTDKKQIKGKHSIDCKNNENLLLKNKFDKFFKRISIFKKNNKSRNSAFEIQSSKFLFFEQRLNKNKFLVDDYGLTGIMDETSKVNNI